MWKKFLDENIFQRGIYTRAVAKNVCLGMAYYLWWSKRCLMVRQSSGLLCRAQKVFFRSFFCILSSAADTFLLICCSLKVSLGWSFDFCVSLSFSAISMKGVKGHSSCSKMASTCLSFSPALRFFEMYVLLTFCVPPSTWTIALSFRWSVFSCVLTY